MCGRLDYYMHLFARLDPTKNTKVWTEETHYCSPYGPFLLLSVLDHIAAGDITRNFIEPSSELAETFQRYIDRLPPMNQQANIAHPLYGLQSSAFWTLKPRQDQQPPLSVPDTLDQFKKMFFGVELDRELFMLLQMPSSRAKLREVLINTYFTEDIRQTIREQA